MSTDKATEVMNRDKPVFDNSNGEGGLTKREYAAIQCISSMMSST